MEDLFPVIGIERWSSNIVYSFLGGLLLVLYLFSHMKTSLNVVTIWKRNISNWWFIQPGILTWTRFSIRWRSLVRQLHIKSLPVLNGIFWTDYCRSVWVCRSLSSTNFGNILGDHSAKGKSVINDYKFLPMSIGIRYTSWIYGYIWCDAHFPRLSVNLYCHIMNKFVS